MPYNDPPRCSRGCSTSGYCTPGTCPYNYGGVYYYPQEPQPWYYWYWGEGETKTTKEIEVNIDDTDMTAVALDGTDLYVAVLLPYEDGSGNFTVLGVFDTKEAAKARCYDCIVRLGNTQPTKVIERPLNYLNEGDPDNQIDDPAVEMDWFDCE